MEALIVATGQRVRCVSPILGRMADAEVIDTSRDPWVLVRCCETGLVFVANPPEYEALVEDFAWQNTFRHERARRRRAEPIVSRVSDSFKAFRSRVFAKREKCFELSRRFLQDRDEVHLLDVGCGRGRLGISLAQRFPAIGVTLVPHGIEISAELAGWSDQQFAKFGGQVVAAPAVSTAAAMPAGSFDLIVLCSLLEHDYQPRLLLESLRGVLKPDGIMVIKVPNYASWMRTLRGRNWCGYRFPDHVNYFTPQTLSRLAEVSGYGVAYQTWREKNPLSDSMYVVLQKSPEYLMADAA